MVSGTPYGRKFGRISEVLIPIAWYCLLRQDNETINKQDALPLNGIAGNIYF